MKTRCFGKPELVIQNVNVFNTAFRKFYPADVYILDGKFYYIDLKKEHKIEAEKVIDGNGYWMVPGLIDIHMHIESSMMTPSVMAERLAECGVTTVVAEPHEMANVNGIQGVLDMIESGRGSLIDIFYGIPSCVPSTNPGLETTGGVFDTETMKTLLSYPNIVCVGEVMNYRQVIGDNELAITGLIDYLAENDPRFVIEGHCPLLTDEELARFIYLGIDSDHTEHNLEELKQRFFQGMYIELQEKMLKREVIQFIDTHALYDHFGFVTDDVMADTLMEKGHLDYIVRTAIELGMSPEQAFYHASYTNAVRMKLNDRGVIAPGKIADFVLLSNPRGVVIEATYKNGRCIYEKNNNNSENRTDCMFSYSDDYYHSLKLSYVKRNQLIIKASNKCIKKVLVEVIEVHDGTTKTTRSLEWLPVKDGIVQWENTNLLLAAVFERYGKNKQIGYGFVTGDFLKKGAVATTYAHDHHNLTVIGDNIDNMILAANTVIEAQGGICVTDDSQVVSFLPLPIGGILSARSAAEIGDSLKSLRKSLHNQGYKHYNPIMSLCTLSLLASPALKLSDFGMIDVTTGAVVPLIRDEIR